MADLIWLVPLFPLAGVLLNGLVFSRSDRAAQRRICGLLASLMVGASFVVAVIIGLNLQGILGSRAFVDVVGASWIEAGSVSIPIALRIDPLSVTMMLVVTGVGFLIHVFSIGYMADDERFGRFFTYLNLFTFSMLILVLANNFVLLFVGWEGVGLCSYLLIGFWFEKVSAAQAGKKAFLVNRVGDFGFLLGMIILFWLTDPHSLVFNLPEEKGALDQASKLGQIVLWGLPAATLICLLFAIGCAGKSAQLPLYLWLPDAMEGPTPVSALIHAATMVTAGVYLVARSAPLFGESPVAQEVVAWTGAITALWAAIIAIKQYDIKRVLAYSTVSQLGFMFIGVGVGSYAAGISHLVTHAFFKALMFLGAGAVMHALDGQLDLRKMGGLRKYLPVTFGTFAIGWLAICGIPPFAGFWSKDAILEAAYHHGIDDPVIRPIFWVGIFVAGLTACYMTRMFVTVFLGSERIVMGDEGHGRDAQLHDAGHGHTHVHGHDHGHGHAHDHGHAHEHEPARHHGRAHVHREQTVMNIPLIILAIGSVFGGIVVFLFPEFLHKVTAGMGHAAAHGAGEAAGAAAHGAAAAGSEGQAHGPETITVQGMLSAWQTWVSVGAAALGIMAAYGIGVEKLSRGWSHATERALGAHQNIYEGLLHGIAVRGGNLMAGFLYQIVDRLIIDKLVDAAGGFVNMLADSLRTLQTGYVRNYALVMLAGAVFVVACFMIILQQLPMPRLLAIGGGVLVLVLALGAVSTALGRISSRVGTAAPASPATEAE